MVKFLETHNLPRLNHEDIGNLNRLIINNQTESVIKPPPKKTNSRSSWLHRLITQNIERRVNIYPFQIIPKFEEEKTLPNSFNEESTTLIPKPGKNHKKPKIIGRYP